MGVATRRAVLASMLAGGSGASVLAGWPASARQATPEPVRPNIVVIQVDDLDSALFADVLPDLPAISSLVATGTSFDRYFVSTPLCGPSRATLLRGQYAHNTGVLWNRGEEGGSGGFEAFHRLGLESSTIATWLQDAGYRTGLVGKYLNNYPMGAEEGFTPPGWDRWVVHASESREIFYYDYVLNIDGETVTYGDAPEDYSTDVIAGFTDRFIREGAEGSAPFFLLTTPYAPHDPADYPDRHASRFGDVPLPRGESWNEEDVSDKPEWVRQLPAIDDAVAAQVAANYTDRLRSMLAIDDLVATVLLALDETGQRENTCIVFTSDNGFHFGEHRIRFGKVTPYDESTRVPLVMAGPGIAAGARATALASNVDLAPTFAEWAGVAVPEFVDGRPLAATAREGMVPDVDAWRSWVLLEQFEVIEDRDRGTPEPKSKTPKRPRARATPDVPIRFTQADVPPFVALRGDESLYVEYASGEREYYELTVDPLALENRYDALPPERVASLSAILAELAACAGETCRVGDAMKV